MSSADTRVQHYPMKVYRWSCRPQPPIGSVQDACYLKVHTQEHSHSDQRPIYTVTSLALTQCLEGGPGAPHQGASTLSVLSFHPMRGTWAWHRTTGAWISY